MRNPIENSHLLTSKLSNPCAGLPARYAAVMESDRRYTAFPTASVNGKVPFSVEGELPSRSRCRQQQYPCDGCVRGSDGRQLLEPPSPVPGRSPSHSSSRTRSLSVSPPLERCHHRAGRRLRAVGEGSHGARARSFSAQPGARRHHCKTLAHQGVHQDAATASIEQIAREKNQKTNEKRK
ncbi:hypothetical protein EMWEY_00044910 [Eimeria maxima]|uniref:Uncharacterized protein n=1 Tax=Eimeria maxima TaxID=5804 RepID=U6MH29_EIMMA|nr:hypothetical protein EMWEY_00044910 [Eimeria maxima]CDJ61769.1 hypothetical protein EMWEY_00044910 [Eimeria maxima]